MRVKVIGYIEIDDDEYDAGPHGPLTEEAFEEYMRHLVMLDDVSFELPEGES